MKEPTSREKGVSSAARNSRQQEGSSNNNSWHSHFQGVIYIANRRARKEWTLSLFFPLEEWIAVYTSSVVRELVNA